MSWTPRCVVVLVLGAVSLLSCKDSSQPPDPSSFKPFEEQSKTDDPRSIVFHNESVEMALLEILAPTKSPKDCESEAPHRLLCPADYRHLFNKRVYPRSKASLSYPKELSLDCAQVWVRVHSKVMKDDEYREAIFLLSKKGRGLELELGGGEAARLQARKLQARNMYPAPVRYCPGEGAPATAAVGARPAKEVKAALKTGKYAISACCKDVPCRGLLTANLTIRRDGGVSKAEEGTVRGQLPTECLIQGLSKLQFSGFTGKRTTAEVSLRLPHKW